MSECVQDYLSGDFKSKEDQEKFEKHSNPGIDSRVLTVPDLEIIDSVFETPVALIVFNRPDLTEIVFRRIAAVRPKKLLVVADGPRTEEEASLCAKVRAIIDQVDWPCEVLTNFSDINLGCRKRVSSGLDWVFSQVEEAIILEDDCLPDLSFFSFCQQMLERYREDLRVSTICGVNYLPSELRSENSYYFSKYCHIWGWASWRRTWHYYDVTLANWPTVRDSGLLDRMLDYSVEKAYWTYHLDESYKGRIDSWDYQFQLACWLAGGLAILPNRNLISNIGFRADATHTQKTDLRANLPLETLGKLQHPAYVLSEGRTERYTFDVVYGGAEFQKRCQTSHRFRLELGSRVLVSARYGLMLCSRYDIFIGRSVEVYGEWADGEMMLLRSLLRPGDVVVEVGANIGTHTLGFARMVGSDGRVIAFEPQKTLFQTLCANVALNGLTQIDCRQMAAGNEAGKLIAPLIDYNCPGNQGGVGLELTGDGEAVEVATLDHLLQLPHLRLIKIDVEGMEKAVIEGAISTLQKHRPFLYVENDRLEHSESLIRTISAQGYRLFWHLVPAFNPDNFAGTQENIFPEGFSLNMLGIPQEVSLILGDLEEVKDPSEHPLKEWLSLMEEFQIEQAEPVV
jgi:FkbM family methyltransferase